MILRVGRIWALAINTDKIVWIFVIPFGITMMQFTFLQKEGVPSWLNIGSITAGIVFMTLLMRTKRYRNPIPLLIASVMISQSILVGLFVLLTESFPIEISEMMKSYFQAIFCAGIIVVACYANLPSMNVYVKSINNLSWLGAIHGILLLSQLILVNIFAIDILVNPFGSFAKYGPFCVPYEQMPWDPFFRPNGFFSEPSAAAWFSSYTLAFSILGYMKFNTSFIPIIFCSIGCLATASGSGIVNLVVLSMCSIFFLNENRSSSFAISVMTTKACFLLLTCTVAIVVVNNRFDEFSTETSSLYLRVIAPARILAESIQNSPFGITLGDERFVIDSGLNDTNKEFQKAQSNSSSSNGAIQNGLLRIAIYWGVSGVILLALMASWTAREVKRGNVFILPVVASVLCGAETGAIWIPSFGLLAAFAAIGFRSSELITSSQEN